MKVLIIKTSALGDIIQSFPVLQYIKRCYPEAQVDWIVEEAFAPLVQSHPALHQAHTVNTKKWRKEFWKLQTIKDILTWRRKLHAEGYDIVFDLQGNLKSGLITSCVKCPKKVGFGISTVHEWPNFFFTNERSNPPKGLNIREDYLYLAQSTFGDFHPEFGGIKLKITEKEEEKIATLLKHGSLSGQGPKIMVCPGSNWTNKILRKEALIDFLEKLSTNLNAHFVFVWGMAEEKELSEELVQKFPERSVVAEKMPLPTLQNLMAAMNLVLAMDSLPLHLAATTPTPTYSVFGASLAQKYKPAGERHASFQGNCPYGKTFEKRCPILRTCQTGSCIKDIQGSDLYAHFFDWWKQLKSNIVNN